MELSAKKFFAAAIDPMALILSTKAYLIWLEIHHPRDPVTPKAIDQVLQKMTPADITVALENVNVLMSYGKIFKEAATKFTK